MKKKPPVGVASCGNAEAQCLADLEAWATGVAEADADRVAAALAAAGVTPDADGTVGLTAAAMLDLAAVLRMESWEDGGIFAHREVGLPSADEAWHRLISRMESESPTAEPFGEFSSGVRRACTTKFVWSAPGLVGADVALSDAAREDLLLDALAAFLWDGRDTSPDGS